MDRNWIRAAFIDIGFAQKVVAGNNFERGSPFTANIVLGRRCFRLVASAADHFAIGHLCSCLFYEKKNGADYINILRQWMYANFSIDTGILLFDAKLTGNSYKSNVTKYDKVKAIQ
ncbi:hypothetical protein [Domibacillus epiphyticus]|uniref:hypothetical protein n=1 Tax=Domibacillus epiphyticus TaxID=1714355 RepID=UPI001300ECB4|nr:hypothetical protein [Domibacillus epiphyticus]